MIICFFRISCRCSIFFFGHRANFTVWLCCIVLRALWSSVSSTSTVVARIFLWPQREIESGCAVLYYEHDDHLFLQPQLSLLDFFFGHSAKFTVWLCCIVLRSLWSSVSSASAVVARYFLRPLRKIHSLVVLCCITSMIIICFFSLNSRCSIFSSATARSSQGS